MEMAGTTSEADTTAWADTATAAGTMGAVAHRWASLRPTVHKRADFRSIGGSAPGGSIHWLRDRSTARRACSERVVPSALAAQREGAYPAEPPPREHGEAAPNRVVHLAGLAPSPTPPPHTIRQSPELPRDDPSGKLLKGAIDLDRPRVERQCALQQVHILGIISRSLPRSQNRSSWRSVPQAP